MQQRSSIMLSWDPFYHDDVIKWKHFPRNWPFVRGIHRSPVNSSHKGQWRGALMFSLINVWRNDWENNREAGDLRRHRAHFRPLWRRRNANINWTLIPAWISMFIHYKVWDGITYPCPNFNGATVEVWEWISNFISHLIGHVITCNRQ